MKEDGIENDGVLNREKKTLLNDGNKAKINASI